ncbi:MlaC/ttg2D family ABC transporter substrate-binding protein [Candidatus Marithrix sp. Canyon 246]|uniref:MlaC/ttg2D family ABC transporter substrate-binding protein n=1 Tax=Candidatus Marithrix sp. Canyon 246 TaxID=1827136 RepID=UPI00084A00E1|nr:ABC transporter substrate-binding protein [Candidatus Marithrix sp. Canyon 246]
MRKIFAGMALICVLMVSGQSVWAAASAETVIKRTTERVLNNPYLLKNPVAVKNIVRGVFNFRKMSRLVLGKNWRRAKRAERKRFTKAFRNLLIRTYSNALSEAAGMVKNIKYSSTRRSSRRTTVHSKVYRRNNSAPVNIDYVMYKRRGKWKVYNVIVEGVSLVTNYRTEFGRDIRRMGMNGLIRKINRKNRGR